MRDLPGSMTETIDWVLAENVARRISGTDPFAESYHALGMAEDFERLTAEAQMHVEAEVGFASLAGPARAKVVDRNDWVRGQHRLIPASAASRAGRRSRNG